MRLLLVSLGFAAGWLGSSFAVAYRFTHRLEARADEPTPAVSWGALQALRLQTRDGEDLGAWFVEGRPSRPAVLLLHENWKNRGSRLDQAKMLAGADCSVLLITLRAHGDSTGELNDFGYSARADVVAAVAWLEKKCPRRPLILWGGSLGAAAALFAAAELGQRVNGYILECPYRDLDTAVRNRTRRYLPPVLEWIAYHGLLAVAPAVLPDWHKISPLEAADGIPARVPVLILAGAADTRALPEEARAMQQRLGERSRLVFFDGCEHMQLRDGDPERYEREILRFVRNAS